MNKDNIIHLSTVARSIISKPVMDNTPHEDYLKVIIGQLAELEHLVNELKQTYIEELQMLENYSEIN